MLSICRQAAIDAGSSESTKVGGWLAAHFLHGHLWGLRKIDEKVGSKLPQRYCGRWYRDVMGNEMTCVMENGKWQTIPPTHVPRKAGKAKIRLSSVNWNHWLACGYRQVVAPSNLRRPMPMCTHSSDVYVQLLNLGSPTAVRSWTIGFQ